MGAAAEGHGPLFDPLHLNLVLLQFLRYSTLLKFVPNAVQIPMGIASTVWHNVQSHNKLLYAWYMQLISERSLTDACVGTFYWHCAQGLHLRFIEIVGATFEGESLCDP